MRSLEVLKNEMHVQEKIHIEGHAEKEEERRLQFIVPAESANIQEKSQAIRRLRWKWKSPVGLLLMI